MTSLTNLILNEINCGDICSDVNIELLMANIRSIKSSPTIVRDEPMYNKFLVVSFAIKGREMGLHRTEVLYHSTADENMNSIKKKNLDWRLVNRTKYGRGVSFSNDFDYADYHSSFNGGVLRAYIITKVLMKKVVLVSDNSHTCPHFGDDTYRSKNGKVVVKFDDFTFLPVHAIYYYKPARQDSAYFVQRRRFIW